MAVRKTKKGAALRRWFKEDWRTPRGNKDYSKGENTFRPTKRVTKDTPTTWSELTPAEKAAAKKEAEALAPKKDETDGSADRKPTYRERRAAEAAAVAAVEKQ